MKLDKKSAELNIAETSINDMIGLILKRLRPIAESNSVEMVFESEREVIGRVDDVKLTLALTNFMENAIKYNKEGGNVYITLDCDYQFFTVTVKDTGIGIPEEAYEHIFERFYRVDKSHSREIGGTGLGLAITKSAVLKHHGAIRVYSREGEGTTFTVRIPLHYEPKEEETT